MNKNIYPIIMSMFLISSASAFSLSDFINNKFNTDFNQDLNVTLEKQWWDHKESTEEGITTSFAGDNYRLEFNVTNTNGGGYKYSIAICNLSGFNDIWHWTYNDATSVWTNIGNLNYGKLSAYGLPSTWCSETEGYGFIAYSSGSKDTYFRFDFPVGDKQMKIYTGSASEELNLNFGQSKILNGVSFTTFDASPTYDQPITMVKLG